MVLAWHSLRLRFLLSILLWVSLGIGAIWYSSVRLFDSHVEQSFHEELEVHLRELARLTQLDARGRPRLTRPLSDPRYEEPLSGFYWQVSVPGRPPLRSASMTRGALDDTIAHSPDVVHTVLGGPTGPAIVYGFTRPAPDGGTLHFVIATDKRHLDRLVRAFTRELSLWLAILALTLLATGIAIISFGLRPLDRLGLAISRLRGGMSPRLEGRYPAEIEPLVSDLNAFIEQNTEIIARARVQAGNLAHSLRTPLAVITDEAERLAESGAAPQAAAVLLDQARRMVQQIEYQLARARSSAGARLPGASSALPELLVPILSAMRRLHRERTFELDADPDDAVVLPVDPVDLSELVSILVDNAGKWAAATVVVAVRRAGGGAVITVTDDGPGMTAAQIAEAFEIGRRFDEAKPGSGLGLAIAREIAGDIGATLELATREAPAPGLRCRIILPG